MINFEQLSFYKSRQYVPLSAHLTDKKEITGLYQILLDKKIGNGEEFEQWILDRSELDSAVSQQRAMLYIRMTLETNNDAFAKAYQDYIALVDPVIQPLEDKLNHRYLALSEQFSKNEKRYEVYNRCIQTDISLFREENIPLEKQIKFLSQEYQKICGAFSIDFQDKEHTLQEMGKYLEEPDRLLREEVWKKISGCWYSKVNEFETLFDELVGLRNEVALNAGFKNFVEYQFAAYHRFFYSPQDCEAYHRVVEKVVIPVWHRILERRKKQMKLQDLRPWDKQVDPLGRSPLRPFSNSKQLLSGVTRIFRNIDSVLAKQFEEIVAFELLDLSSRKGKAHGGYQQTLDETRKPFIFMNAVGIDYDVRTLLHEAGHAFHAIASASDPLLFYRHAPLEFSEVASMSMELIGGGFLNAFYSEEEMKRSHISHLEDIVYLLSWVATIDAFQHSLYAQPEHTREERKEMWLNVRNRFGGNLFDWSGFEEYHGYLWHKQLHVFEVPFYYIEYGIAQLGALQMWFNYKKDPHQAMEYYRKALSLGGSKPLPELFRAGGIKFDFSEATIKPLIEVICKEINL